MHTTRLPLAVGMVALLFGAHAHAQCTMDIECTGDLICEKGSCVAPPPAASQVTTAAPAAAPPVAAPPVAAPAVAPTAAATLSPPPPQLVPHSETMMGAGIFTVVVGGAAFVGAMGAFFSEAACGIGPGLFGQTGSGRCDENDGYILGGFLASMVLVGAGVTLITVGKHKEPASPKSSATLAPWVGRQSGGLSLRFDL